MKKVIYRQNKEVIFREEGDEAIIFNPETSDIVVVNSTGCFVWSLLDGKRPKEEIIRTMVTEFDASHETIQKDLESFLVVLEKRNFIANVQSR